MGKRLHRQPAEWQMPVGVTAGLWDYLHSSELAANYDAYLGAAGVGRIDARLVAELAGQAKAALDLGCGTGRTLLALAEAGVPVLVGVDLSAPMLDHAARKTAAFRQRIWLAKENLVTLPSMREESFDLITCLFSTLGLVRLAAARADAVRRAAALLRPGGWLVLHGHNRNHNLWVKGGRRWLLHNLLRSLRGDADAGDWPMPAHQGVAGLVMHLFTRGELRRLMMQAGLRVERIVAVGQAADGSLPQPWLLPSLRAQGFLIVGRKDGE